jgi:Na+/H+ antiporter NhaD/arsenite permease-like protein
MGAISLEEAYAAIDMNTIVLLFAMMIINVNLRLAGFFRLVNRHLAQWAHTPRGLLALIVGVGGVLSALFLNDTIMLMFTPLVVELTVARRRNSIPYVTFMDYLAPVAVVGLVLAWGVLVVVYRAEFTAVTLPPPELPPDRPYRPLLRKSMVATGLMLVAFVVGVPVPLAALAAAGLLLITRRLKPERVFREIDWTLLVFFAALFVVTGAIVTSGLSDRLFAVLQPIAERGRPLN